MRGASVTFLLQTESFGENYNFDARTLVVECYTLRIMHGQVLRFVMSVDEQISSEKASIRCGERLGLMIEDRSLAL